MKKGPRKGEFHWAYNDHCILIRIARLCRRNKQQLESQWLEKTKVYFSLTLCVQGLFHIVFTQPLTGRAATSWNLADHLGGKKRGASSRPCIGKYTLPCVQRADGWEHPGKSTWGPQVDDLVCCCVLATQSCLTICDPMDCSPPGSSVHGIPQARILEWVAMPFSRGSSQPRDRTRVSCTAGRCFALCATREVLLLLLVNKRLLWATEFSPRLNFPCNLSPGKEPGGDETKSSPLFIKWKLLVFTNKVLNSCWRENWLRTFWIKWNTRRILDCRVREWDTY